MKGDVSGVRIEPNNIKFSDTHINEAYSANITVKNISSVSKSIRYYAPQNKVRLVHMPSLDFGLWRCGCVLMVVV